MVDRADQTVLTTGSNSGIGLVTVLEASRLGYRSVGSVCLRTESWKDVEAAGEAGHRVGSPYVRTYQRPAAGLRLSQPFMGRTRQVARGSLAMP